jgi:hypothetical protein
LVHAYTHDVVIPDKSLRLFVDRTNEHLMTYQKANIAPAA